MSERKSVRRIVTGHDENGKAIIITDGQPPNAFDSDIRGTFFTEIWKTSATPAPVGNETDPTLGPRKMSPHANGSAVRIVQIGPESESNLPSVGNVEEMRVHFAALGSPEAATVRADSPHPLMHRTETVDYGIVIEGEVTLILDDSEVTLGPGDIVVQRGTNHAWSNHGDKPCRIAFVLIDGQYTAETKAALERWESR